MQFIQKEKLNLENNPTASSQLPTKNEMRQYLDRIPSWLKNKYVLTVLCFGVWVLFIDDRDFVTTHFRAS